jgi:hypothetical protein
MSDSFPKHNSITFSYELLSSIMLEFRVQRIKYRFTPYAEFTFYVKNYYTLYSLIGILDTPDSALLQNYYFVYI